MMETEEQVTMRFTVFLKVELQKKKKKNPQDMHRDRDSERMRE